MDLSNSNGKFGRAELELVHPTTFRFGISAFRSRIFFGIPCKQVPNISTFEKNHSGLASGRIFFKRNAEKPGFIKWNPSWGACLRCVFHYRVIYLLPLFMVHGFTHVSDFFAQQTCIPFVAYFSKLGGGYPPSSLLQCFSKKQTSITSGAKILWLYIGSYPPGPWLAGLVAKFRIPEPQNMGVMSSWDAGGVDPKHTNPPRS